MAVINCPNCKKKISDKAKSCSHCSVDMENLSSEKLHSMTQQQKIKKSQALMTQSFIAMLLFCGGFLFLYSSDTQPGNWQHTVSVVSILIGFFLYIITRIRLIIFKRSSKL